MQALNFTTYPVTGYRIRAAKAGARPRWVAELLPSSTLWNWVSSQWLPRAMLFPTLDTAQRTIPRLHTHVDPWLDVFTTSPRCTFVIEVVRNCGQKHTARAYFNPATRELETRCLKCNTPLWDRTSKVFEGLLREDEL